MGSDELHHRILKELAAELGPVFAHLFRQSLDIGEIPEEWSLANTCPLFKKGNRALASNYRPVSMTCYLSTYSNIMDHLEKHRLLSDQNKSIKETKYRYCWIKNLSRLLCDQNKHKEKHTSATVVCMASQKKTYSLNTKKTVVVLIKIQ